MESILKAPKALIFKREALLSGERREFERQRAKFLNEIRDVRMRIESAHYSFAQQTDGDMIEASIYEIKALKAHYSYLIRVAKENDYLSRIDVSLLQFYEGG